VARNVGRVSTKNQVAGREGKVGNLRRNLKASHYGMYSRLPCWIDAKGGRPDGSALLLEELLRTQFPISTFVRPRLLHSNSEITADDSLENLRHLDIPQGSMVIGISLGGLLAAKLQESGRNDLGVVCISSPTWADGVSLSRRVSSVFALVYS
jgi:hypothetical protein